MKLKRSLRSRIGWTNVKIGAFKASASSALHLQVQVRLLRTSGLSREQRGLGRLKLTRTPLQGQRSRSRYRDFLLPGIFTPRSESSQWEPSLPGTKVPSGNLRSRERMFLGTFVPGIVSSLSDDGKGCWRCSVSKSKNVVK